MSANLLHRRVAVPEPWTLPLTIARSLLFLGTGLTLTIGPSWAVFTPSNGKPDVLDCSGVSALSLFCATDAVPLDLVTRSAGVLLLVFATGLLPWLTALPAAWILLSVPLSGTLVDGGDQLAGILGVLLIPVSITDWRWNPWRGALPGTSDSGAAVLIGNVSWWLMRAQIVVVYLEACIGKIAVPEWAGGTALYAWERHPNFGAPDWAQPLVYAVTAQPLITALLTFAVMATEFSIAISPVLPRSFRTRVLYPCGAALHLGIILFMGVSSFSIVMFAALTLLVLPIDVDVRGIRPLSPQKDTAPSPAGSPAETEEERSVAPVP